jgi:hypothetical protein
MPGYAPTPTYRKLGLKPGHELLLIDAPAAWQLSELPEGVAVRRLSLASTSAATCDVAMVFVRCAAALNASVAVAGRIIYPAAAAWIAWPRRAAGHTSDVTENAIRDAALPLGLVDIKVAAVDDDWSGLKIVWRRERR